MTDTIPTRTMTTTTTTAVATLSVAACIPATAGGFDRSRSADNMLPEKTSRFTPAGFLAVRPAINLNCWPCDNWRADVATGTVKWFNATKGYGFIQPDSGGKDVFVHISAVERAGFTGLVEGAKISYEVVTDRGKESAGNLRIG
jgi:cold shock protein